ncbi:MAG: glycosyltransferase [Bacteroidota bacterium]
MNVIYLGCNGFPVGYAQVQKQKMISKALIEAGSAVTVVSYKGVLKNTDKIKIPYKGEVEGIKYIFTSLSASRPENFMVRNFMKVLGTVFEFFTIILKTAGRRKSVAIITTNSLRRLIYYRCLLKILNCKVVFSYEEFWQSTFGTGDAGSFKNKLDQLAGKYCDAILPISDFLAAYQKNINKSVKLFKLPTLADFDLIDAIDGGERVDRILFCGASAYIETIEFIIDAFRLVEHNDIKLMLIIHGDAAQNEKISGLVRRSGKGDKIQIQSGLPYEQLIRLYKSSRLLLIPLRPVQRDEARFPHKISEYTASKTPFVTTAVGEVNTYFADGENAYIAKDFNAQAYAGKIMFALDNPQLSQRIANNAYNLGRANFDYKSISKSLDSFLNLI